MLESIGPEFRKLTTIHLGGKGLALLEPETEADLGLLEERARQHGGSLFYLGRGSNLLAREGALAIVAVSMRCWRGLEILRKEGASTLVYAQSGVPLARLLRFCAQSGLSGLEGLTGIPGNVGGACAMNAGSFGDAIGPRLHALEVWDGESIRQLGRDQLVVAYRSLKLANSSHMPLITAGIFALTTSAKSVILGRMNLNYIEKKSRQPLDAWSAGCAFKNPPDQAAGRLLEAAGFRGRELGGMQFSLKHANFLVNTGKGSPAAALELLGQAREEVHKRSGIWLEPEIKIIP